MKHLHRVLLTILVLASLGAFSGTVSAVSKVTICHVPPGNPDNAHNITVSKSAVNAHMAHGDSVGSCDGEICAQSTEWGIGWIVFTDDSGSAGDMDGSDQLLRSYQPTGTFVSITSAQAFVRYTADGSISE